MRRVALVLAALMITGCAAQNASAPPLPTTPRAPVNLVADDYQGRFRVAATVLESPSHGPQLCQAVAESLPPQCGGPDIAGWKWEAVKHESANGTRWGVYLLTGTFDGRKFTLTEPAKTDDGSLNQVREPDYTSPCPTPAGGWKPVDPAKATDDAMNAANVLVAADPDFGGLWIDQSTPATGATPANDPGKYVLNVRFTKDLARHEAEIRKIWGGALCVSQARFSEARLREIQDELTGEPGMHYASAEVVSGTVEIGVFVARAGRVKELDAKYGEGVVNLVGALRPID